ncbi:hypothetical protein DRH27_03415 [Candidatus Falkowbacteria bacterium]|nr:MAG: hypothetical protein DRH27_03415 [Candidatus Falkowbacteria bacterium]
MMDLKNYIILISALINLFLGITVYLKGRDKTINKVYFVLAASVFYWGVSMVLYRAVATIEMSVLFCRILYTAPIFIVGSFLYFSYIFPSSIKQVKKVVTLIIIILSFLFFYLSLFTNSIVNDVILRIDKEKIINFGAAYFLYSIYISGFFVWGYVNLIKKRIRSSGIVRAQLTYVFLGTFIASTLGMVTNLTLPTFGYFEFNWAGQILSLFMVVFIAYAIIRHRLMDIKMVMRRYSVYTVSLATIIILLFSLGWTLNKLFPEFIFWNDTIILIFAITIFPAVKNYFYKTANKYFFSSLYDSREVIAGISDKLRRTLDVNIIFDYIFETINDAFHVKSFGILRYREGKDVYVAQYNKGFNIKWQQEFKSNKELHEIYIKKNQTLILEEARSKYYNNKTKDTIDMLTGLNIDILTPLNVKDKTVGLLALGPKESGDMYNDEDLQVLEIIGAQAAIAIENALLFEETKQFGLKLEKEVKKATGDLRKANVKLTKLDAAKSEFISIASHQLRTPLTIIKGYISMILEGSFGELTEGEEDSLEKVYESNERLIQLVENLLNISRIESGRLQFNFERMQLEILTHSVCEELETSAKKKGVKLVLKAPKKTLPAIKIDQEKIRQVIMNLIDNAIKYTKKGTVTIYVKKIKPSGLKGIEEGIEFSVADSGMGITRTDLPNLFKKFSRGTDTSLVHTEGTGLGLFVAKQMIEAHHGKIWAESKGDGKGSRFCFVLPIA